jgi:hypothetical protein
MTDMTEPALEHISNFKIQPRKEPWYRAGKEDDFSIRKKILREGCRGIYREVIECRNVRLKDF